MPSVKYPIGLCICLFICILFVCCGIVGTILSATMNPHSNCKKLNNCVYYVIYYDTCECQQCMVLIPGSNCQPFPVMDPLCPNTTICYMDNIGCPYPNPDFDQCYSIQPIILLILSILFLVLMIMSLFFTIGALYKNYNEYIKLINQSTGIINC